MNSANHDDAPLDPRPGAAIYTAGTLALYDLVVLGVSNRYLWRCPTPELLAWYDRHVSDRHLDVGVGTGYFLDRCRFPSPQPTLALLDLSDEALRFTAHRVRRYHPVSYTANILEPLPEKLRQEPGLFRSIGLNYVLHCLPGDMAAKAPALHHLRQLLAPGGVLFGSTIMGLPAPSSRFGRALMRTYNQRGIFSNQSDSRQSLEQVLRECFGAHRYELKQLGSVVLFAART